MFVEEFSNVIYFSMDNNPAVLRKVVLADLCSGEHESIWRRHHRHLGRQEEVSHVSEALPTRSIGQTDKSRILQRSFIHPDCTEIERENKQHACTVISWSVSILGVRASV
jgi:hypothetical protein